MLRKTCRRFWKKVNKYVIRKRREKFPTCAGPFYLRRAIARFQIFKHYVSERTSLNCLKLFIVNDPAKSAKHAQSILFLKVGHSQPLFIYFRLINTVDIKQMLNKILPMTGVEPRTSGIESDRSTN